MIRVKQYDMNDQYMDIVATFPKREYGPELPKYGHDQADIPKESYWNEVEQDRKMELNKERSIQRTKTKVKRYVIHKNMKYMWTLTFAKKHTQVVSSKGIKTYDTGELKDAWTLWSNFMKRCQRAGLRFDYIVTIEVQEGRLEQFGEKVYHFHFATNQNLPIDQEKAKKRGYKHSMLSLWGHGRIHVSKQKSKKKFANVYLMKYITKMFDVCKGSQRYRCSERMSCPEKVLFFNSEQDLDMYVWKLVNHRDLAKPFKAYFPITDGHNEVLFYGLTPK